MPRPMVLIESPFSAQTESGLVRNVYYAMLAVRDSLGGGEAPYASHLFYTQMLDDEVASERQTGIDAGLDIGRFAEKTVVYVDLGTSRGMKYGISLAKEQGRPVETRRLFDENLSPEELTETILRVAHEHHLPGESAIVDIYGRILTKNN